MSLRTDIAKAIMKGIYEDSDVNGPMIYNPDTMYRAADEVIAILMTKLSGYTYEAEPPMTYIGPAKFITDGVLYE